MESPETPLKNCPNCLIEVGRPTPHVSHLLAANQIKRLQQKEGYSPLVFLLMTILIYPVAALDSNADTKTIVSRLPSLTSKLPRNLLGFRHQLGIAEDCGLSNCQVLSICRDRHPLKGYSDCWGTKPQGMSNSQVLSLSGWDNYCYYFSISWFSNKKVLFLIGPVPLENPDSY